MVILRSLSDDEEGGFSKIHPLGSALENQIRNHHTRADGSIDYDGYFKSLLNAPLSYSDLDSVKSSDSDCVIISPSSFTGKRRDTTLAVFVAQSVPETMDDSSKYQTLESVLAFRRKTILFGTNVESDVVTEPVGEDEVVTDVNIQLPHFFYMYTAVIKTFNIWFPFTSFEVSILRTMNIAPVS
ncbi:hypothetical protein QL285_038917 [Trifolium repens]|nr:hypothetical protein QL285_038917 [Trifolium repens]